MVVTIHTLWLNVFFPFLFIVTNDGCKSPCDGVLRRKAFKYTKLLGLRHDVQFSVLNALKWVKKPLRWTNKMVSFKTIPSCCQLKSHIKTYSLPEKARTSMCVINVRSVGGGFRS